LHDQASTREELLHSDALYPPGCGILEARLWCWSTDHISRPVEALLVLKDFVKPGGTIMAIEGDEAPRRTSLGISRPVQFHFSGLLKLRSQI